MKNKRLTSEVRRELILQAALEVFSDKGFQGATVKKIAERADINEGLLYRHFKSKEDLYTAILDRKAVQSPVLEDPSLLTRGKEDDHQVLKRFAQSYLRVMRANEKLVKLISFGQLANPDLASPNLFKIPYKSTEESPVSILSNYFKAKMKEGTFVKKNPQLVARIFVGSVHWYGLRSLIAKSKQWNVYDEDEVLDTMVSLFLDGVVARDVKKDKGGGKRK